MFDFVTFLKTCPKNPAVYMMLDTNKSILYIGKAKNLKKRLHHYYKAKLDAKTSNLVAQIYSINYTIVSDEQSALILEAELIKKNQPKYNRLLKDDKAYPYLIMSHHNFPQLFLKRAKKLPKGAVFGPFSQVKALESILQWMQKTFKVRHCNDSFFRSRSKPCIQYQLKRCSAPCVSLISKETYQNQVAKALSFLSGHPQDMIHDLTGSMNDAAKEQKFEQAASFRDLIRTMQQLIINHPTAHHKQDFDCIAWKSIANHSVLVVMHIHNSQLSGQKEFYWQSNDFVDGENTLEQLICQYYLNQQSPTPKSLNLLIAGDLPNKRELSQSLSLLFCNNTVVQTNVRMSIKKSWLKHVQSHAQAYLEQRLQQHNNWSAALDSIASWLEFTSPITCIECVDISHQNGQHTVGGVVVFSGQGIEKGQFRGYHLEGVNPGDDCDALYQLIVKRFSKRKQLNKPLPELLLIDGGLAQRNAVAKALEDLQIDTIFLIAIAKGITRKPGFETLWLKGNSTPISLDKTDPILKVIQYIRDHAHKHAHRYAIKWMTQTKLQSGLLLIPGIGKTKRTQLLSYFGGIQEVKKASVNSLMQAPGINKIIAERIVAFFHETP
jgi:excinuclease ABC subunit C